MSESRPELCGGSGRQSRLEYKCPLAQLVRAALCGGGGAHVRIVSGYYNVILIDPVTGIKKADKSTHTKDQIEAATIATTWRQNGNVPVARPNARSYPKENCSKNRKTSCPKNRHPAYTIPDEILEL